MTPEAGDDNTAYRQANITHVAWPQLLQDHSKLADTARQHLVHVDHGHRVLHVLTIDGNRLKERALSQTGL